MCIEFIFSPAAPPVQPGPTDRFEQLYVDLKDDVPAKAENDGGITTVNYSGEATTLTFTFAAQTYLHSVTVYNVSEFLVKDASGYYIVPSGDAAALLMAINSASGEEGAKVFLPNGTCYKDQYTDE